MEPADIDWKSIESKYVKDELYEHINAPKWLDLSAPDSAFVDDEAWFCRKDCRHPKTYEDFKKLSPSPKMKTKKSGAEVLPLGERKSNNQSLKRRGAVAALLPLPSLPIRNPAKNKGNLQNYREDLENQDPNLDTSVRTCTSSTPNKPPKSLKEAIKSSADKSEICEEENVEVKSNKKVPRLKSTLSARNLFSGRDILGQLSEFCNEIKKLATGKEKSSNAAKEVGIEEERKVLLESNSKDKNDRPVKSVKRIGKLTVKVENDENNFEKVEESNKMSVLKEVRAYPPTPQKFPSPSSRLLLTKTGTSTISPLNKKPLKPEIQAQGKGEKRELMIAKDVNDGSSMDMFWFFKPCTTLI